MKRTATRPARKKQPAGAKGLVEGAQPAWAEGLVEGALSWLWGLPLAEGRERASKLEKNVLAGLRDQEQNKSPSTPLTALRAMMVARDQRHLKCTEQQCEHPAESESELVPSGSYNVVTPFSATYRVRAGYEYTTLADLACRRRWADVLAREGISTPCLLRGYATPAVESEYDEQLRQLNHSAEFIRQESSPCGRVPGTAEGLPGPVHRRRAYGPLVRRGEEVALYLADRSQAGFYPQVLKSVYQALGRYVALLRRPGKDRTYFCIDLKFRNMLWTKDRAYLTDLEPYDGCTVEPSALPQLKQQLYDGCTVELSALPQLEKQLRAARHQNAWTLALYLFALANSVGSLDWYMKQRGFEEPAPGRNVAIAVLRDKAARVGRNATGDQAVQNVGGAVARGLGQAILLLARASWHDQHFKIFAEQVEA
eukprot:g24448.t1